MTNKTPTEQDPPCDGKCATDECVCWHKDTHADDGATASYEALIKALRNDLEKEHRKNVELLGALKQAAVLDTSSERDFRRALVAAVSSRCDSFGYGSSWDEHCKLMREMDVDCEGNYGFPVRAAWFLAEMRRQVKEEVKP